MKKFKCNFGVRESIGPGLYNPRSLNQKTPRVEVLEIFGVLDGEKVDVSVDGARVYFRFRDNLINKRGIFDPKEDKFVTNDVHFGTMEYLCDELNEEEEFVVRGCLSRLTGLLRDKPIPAEEVDFDFFDDIVKKSKKTKTKES